MRHLIRVLVLIMLPLIISCNDGLFGHCSSLADEYCSGVYSCYDHSGDKYIKVGSKRHSCLVSKEWEDYYECSYGYYEANEYCDEKDDETVYVEIEEEKPAPVQVCYIQYSYDYFVCYSLLSREECIACGMTYGKIEGCDADWFYRSSCIDTESDSQSVNESF